MERNDTPDEELMWLRLRFREHARTRGVAYAERMYASDMQSTAHFRVKPSLWSWVRAALCA